MRTLAIGDIHGCDTALFNLLRIVEPTTDDLVVALGDYVDRGPNSKGVVDWLIEFSEDHHLVCLKGNHEAMMLDAKREGLQTLMMWRSFGGAETLESYAEEGSLGSLEDVTPQHWDWLENTCLRYYETERYIFVHAGVYPNQPMNKQSESVLLWEKLYDRGPHISGKVVICGHTAQKSGRPLSLGHTVGIDTWVYGEGWLTCLEPDTGRYWQANEQGETREGTLDVPLVHPSVGKSDQ